MKQRRGRNRERQPRRIVARWHFECGRRWRAVTVTISDCGTVRVQPRDPGRVPAAQKEAAADAVADFLHGCFALTHDQRYALLWG